MAEIYQQPVALASVYDARRANLRRLLEPRGAKAALATALDVTAPNISHFLREPGEKGARPVHEDLARQIETALRLQPYELDRPFGPLGNQPTPAHQPVRSPRPTTGDVIHAPPRDTRYSVREHRAGQILDIPKRPDPIGVAVHARNALVHGNYASDTERTRLVEMLASTVRHMIDHASARGLPFEALRDEISHIFSAVVLISDRLSGDRNADLVNLLVDEAAARQHPSPPPPSDSPITGRSLKK